MIPQVEGGAQKHCNISEFIDLFLTNNTTF